MGILNITPDSFSDGGHFIEPEVALSGTRRRLVDEGARIIDVGAESTRPDGVVGRSDIRVGTGRARPEGPAGASRRVTIVGGLEVIFQISIDSRNPTTVRSALEIGVDILNDVTGFRHPKMLELADGHGRPTRIRAQPVDSGRKGRIHSQTIATLWSS